MLRTYFTTFLRKFKKERLFSLLNLGGLTVGLTTVLLIGLYVYDELSYDKFHSKSEDIYLLYSTAGKNVAKSDRVSYRLVERIKEEVPEIDKVVSLNKRDLLVVSEQNSFLKNQVVYTTKEIFDVFDFPLLYGDFSMINDPSSAFVTKKTAERFFGDATLAMGKQVTVDERSEYTIAGVIEDIPANSTIQFEFLLPGQDLFEERIKQDSEGGWFPTENWLILSGNADRKAIATKMEALARAMPFAQVYEYTENAQNIFLLPLEKYRLRAELDYSSNTRSDVRYVYLFTAIGVLVLIIAIINYTNLSTAQSIKRAKEVGLRKVIGASRRQVLSYYLIESRASMA
jgi:putative ABC transport system permease protein